MLVRFRVVVSAVVDVQPGDKVLLVVILVEVWV